MEKKATKKEWLGLIIGFIGIMLGCLMIRLMNRYLLMSIPLIPRMITMVVSYWLCALAPIVLLFFHKDRLSDYGFTKDGLLLQIVIGLGIGLLMSVFFTLVPHLFGFGGNIFQVFITMLIGLFFCFLRWKIKKCSTLSLIICHGVYDAMITVWASVLPG